MKQWNSNRHDTVKLDFDDVSSPASALVAFPTRLRIYFSLAVEVSSAEIFCLIPRDLIELGIARLHHELSSPSDGRIFMEDLRCNPMKTIYLVMPGRDNVPKSGVYVQTAAVSCQFSLYLRRFFPRHSPVSIGKKDYIVYRARKQKNGRASARCRFIIRGWLIFNWTSSESKWYHPVISGKSNALVFHFYSE